MTRTNASIARATVVAAVLVAVLAGLFYGMKTSEPQSSAIEVGDRVGANTSAPLSRTGDASSSLGDGGPASAPPIPGKGGTNSQPEAPGKFERTWLAAIVFDYSQLPDDAVGTLMVRHDDYNTRRFETSLADRPARLERLKADTYTVFLLGSITWKSEPITLAKDDEVTVTLGSSVDSQSVSVVVEDAETGEPLPGASLMLSTNSSPGIEPEPVPGLLANTDATGRGVLYGQPVEVMSYWIEKFGYLPVLLDSQPISRGECSLGTVRLRRANGELEVDFDVTGLELAEDETATVSTRLFDMRARSQFWNGVEREPVPGPDDWGDFEHDALIGSRRYSGMVPGRDHTLLVTVLVRNAAGGIIRHGNFIKNFAKSEDGKIVVTASDLKIRERR